MSAVNDEALSKQRDDLIEKNQFSEATQMLAENAKGLFTRGDQSWRFRAPEEAATYLVHIQAAKWKIVPQSEMQVDKCNDLSVDVAESGRIFSCALFSRDGLQLFGVSLLKYTGVEIKPDDRKVPWNVFELDARTCEITPPISTK